MQKTEIDKIIEEIKQEARKYVGSIITDDEYVIKKENNIIRIIRPFYCIPSSSKYPIDPRIDCFPEKIILETDNPIEIVDKLIEMVNDKISRINKYIEELIVEEDYERDDDYVLSFYEDIEKYEKIIKILKEIKEGKIRKGTVKVGNIFEINLDKLFS